MLIISEHGVEIMNTQVAGHCSFLSAEPMNQGLGMLRYKNYALKAMQSKLRGLNEVLFYENIFRAIRDCNDKKKLISLNFLMNLIPKYFGITSLKVDVCQPAYDYLVLSDVTSCIHPLCVMDVKIGKRTYEDNAPEVKKLYEISKYPAQSTVGFRYAGIMNHYCMQTDAKNRFSVSETIRLDKHWGRSLDEKSVLMGLVRYFYDGYGSLRIWPLLDLSRQLDEICLWAKSQTVARFISSSLLIVYPPNDMDDYQEKYSQVSVKLIDFAHSHIHENSINDDEFSFGIKSFSTHVAQLVSIARDISDLRMTLDEICTRIRGTYQVILS